MHLVNSLGNIYWIFTYLKNCQLYVINKDIYLQQRAIVKSYLYWLFNC